MTSKVHSTHPAWIAANSEMNHSGQLKAKTATVPCTSRPNLMKTFAILSMRSLYSLNVIPFHVLLTSSLYINAFRSGKFATVRFNASGTVIDSIEASGASHTLRNICTACFRSVTRNSDDSRTIVLVDDDIAWKI